MAQPIMFSATTTGPETEKTEPWRSAPWPFAGAMIGETEVEDEGSVGVGTGEGEMLLELELEAVRC